MNQKEKRLDELLSKVKKVLPNLSVKYQIQTIEVFGSYVRGDAKEGSI